ncbi:Uu.00g016360.m01.CDS01 [Anthostomella pinea]|uniref:non-specific serine/threonine protein kinase n=1 Tax=Anthostomella pinea TaxID=933095 RepID=A0AAI8YN99_9PEZI|nr:Uu.00g016360.m01.CDS01 [Anthostomella pinea]
MLKSISESGSIASTAVDGPRDNGLMIEYAPFGLEKVYDYEPGGHHPVHLGDVLHSRYKIIHKLGSGGYANVWLARDICSDVSKYAALKVIMAEGSTDECPELRVNKLVDCGLDTLETADYFCLPLDQFKVEGPNGTHLVFAYPVLGPRASRLISAAMSDHFEDSIRGICRQVTQAMADLHARGICHGDFRPANILARISNLDGLSEDEVMEAFGTPQRNKVLTISGEDHDLPSAPQYLVYPVDWDSVATNSTLMRLISGKACIVDWGETYDIASPPEELGLWALGCTLFEIRTGKKLFDTFDDDVDEHLCKIAMVLGKFPEPWWNEIWDQRDLYLKDDVDALDRVVEVRDAGAAAPSTLVVEAQEPRSIQDSVAGGLFYSHKYAPGGIHRDISQEEVETFSDLLSKLLQYRPEDRLSASQALQHPWFELSHNRSGAEAAAGT